MKREILFRGKSIRDNKFVYGNLILNYEDGNDCIFNTDHKLRIFSIIDPETVGQYTGLTDKNGVKIFEGDFVREKTNPCLQNKDCIAEPDPLRDRYEIKWDERRNGWNAFPKTSLSSDDFNVAIQQLGGLITWPCDDVLSNSWHYAIIGNIHDNPELLK